MLNTGGAQDKLNAFSNDVDAIYLSSAHFGNVEYSVGKWLIGSRSSGDIAPVEGKEGYYLLCYADLSPYTVWEWQAIKALQEGEYAAWLADEPVKTRKVPKLPEAAMTRSTQ